MTLSLTTSRVRGVTRGVLGGLAAVLLPSACRVCERPLVTLSTVPVCGECVAALQPQEVELGREALCGVCSALRGWESSRFEAGYGEQRCQLCRAEPPAFRRAVAYGVYRDELRELLHLLKYNRLTRLVPALLASRLVQAVDDIADELATGAVVVAVPMFRARRAERGFNQAELLADGALRLLRQRHPGLRLRSGHEALVRTRSTRELFHLQPGERRAGLAGAFRVTKPEQVRGCDVLLVDDIMTTGATARECGKVLMAAGAHRVFVATVARAQEELQVGSWDAGAVVGFGAAAGR